MPPTSFLDTPSGRLAYSRTGKGQPVVLLHPIGIDRRWWDNYVAVWAADYDVIAVDFRGHGESSRVTSPITLDDHAADVAAILRAEHVASAHLAGVSMGGMVAQRVAIDYLDLVASLILCATAGAFPDEVRPRIRARGDTSRTGVMSEVVEGTLDRWFLASRPQAELVERCRLELLAEDWYGWSANWEAIAALDNLQGLAQVRVPALVVAAADDASIPPALVEKIAQALPNATFINVPGTSHFGAFETPEHFEPRFRQFLQKVVG